MAEIVKKVPRFSFGKKSKKKLIIIATAFVVLCGGGVYGYQKLTATSTMASAMFTETVKRGDVTETVSATGSVQSSKQLSISFSNSGEKTISTLLVQIGDHVKKGQVLATLDDTEAKTAVKNAEANLASAKAKYEEALHPKTKTEIAVLQANVLKAKASLEEAKTPYDTEKAMNSLAKAKLSLQNAQSTYNTQKKLYDQGIISKSELDQQKMSLDQAQSEYDSAVVSSKQTEGQSKNNLLSQQAAYDSAVAQLEEATTPQTSTVESARASMLQAEASYQEAKDNLANMSLKAPIDAIVVEQNGHVGEVPSNPFVVLDDANTANLEVMAQISQSDIGKIKEGMNATFTSTTYEGKTFAGKVKLIYPNATTESGVTTYSVLLSVDNKDGLLKSGMTTNITIEVGTHKDVLYVSSSALQTQNGKDGVFVATSSQTTQSSAQSTEQSGDQAAKGDSATTRSKNTRSRQGNFPYHFQAVTTGYYGANKVEITDGLKEGDQVVIIVANSTSSTTSSTKRQEQNDFGGMPGMGGSFGGGGGTRGNR